MPKPDSIALVAAAEVDGLESLLVGGNAVNLYAYRRTTFDVDLLVREREVARWLSFFEQRGYEIFHRTPNFVRLRFAADPAQALPVDLMLVDEETFEKIRVQSQRREIGKGVALSVPAPLHLLAMKLHALKSQARFEGGVDFQDVIHLIRTAKIDIHSSEFLEMPIIMAQKRSEPEFSGSSNRNRIRENNAPDLPEFDSLPAAAGLSNVEAFELSIRHALAVLPAVLAKGDFRDRATNPERFSLR